MVKKIFVVLFSLILCVPAISGPCDEYKRDVDIVFQKAKWTTKIQSSDKDLWPVGGFVEVKPFYKFSPKVGYVFNGKFYCVYLDSVEAEVGFQDFVITIDKKYKKDSCEYNAVLEHEHHHINDAVAALDNIYDGLKDVFTDAVNSVEPIYVTEADSVPVAYEKIQNQITNDKKLQELVEKFKKQTEQDAANLDGTPDEALQKCTVDKVNAAFEKYFNKNK